MVSIVSSRLSPDSVSGEKDVSASRQMRLASAVLVVMGVFADVAIVLTTLKRLEIMESVSAAALAFELGLSSSSVTTALRSEAPV